MFGPNVSLLSYTNKYLYIITSKIWSLFNIVDFSIIRIIELDKLHS